MSKLLVNENPLVLLPSLAVKLGLNQAIVIQQIHYWLQTSKTKINDKKWVYNTIDEWHEQFPFFSRSTLERAISSLVKDGFLIVEKLSGHKSDRTNYYTIDYIKLNQPLRQNDVTITSNCGDDNVKMTESTITSNCGDGYTEITETTTYKNNISDEVLKKTNEPKNGTVSEQDYIDKVSTDNKPKNFALPLNWNPDNSLFGAYCLNNGITPNQLTNDILKSFCEKANAKGESKTEAQWCLYLAKYLKTCLNNLKSNKTNPHLYQPEQEGTQQESYKPNVASVEVPTPLNDEERQKRREELKQMMGEI